MPLLAITLEIFKNLGRFEPLSLNVTPPMIKLFVYTRTFLNHWKLPVRIIEASTATVYCTQRSSENQKVGAPNIYCHCLSNLQRPLLY